MDKLTTSEGCEPDLEAIKWHLDDFLRRCVFVQEVYGYGPRNNWVVPALKHGRFRELAPSTISGKKALTATIGAYSVQFQEHGFPLSGVARIASDSEIIYEDRSLVKAWDALFTFYENRVRTLGEDESAREHELRDLTRLAPSDPLVQFAELCRNRLHLLGDYGFAKNKQGIYVRDEK